MEYIEEIQKAAVAGSYDVIVAGGGVAGIAAALAARRAGRSVLLIEKSGMLGGLATLGLVNYFVPMCNGRGVQVIKGLAEELLRLSVAYGYDSLSDAWRNGEPSEPTTVRYDTRYSPSIFAVALTELLNREGVKLHFDALAVRPKMHEKRCEGVFVEDKSGLRFFKGKMIVDTTGDADLLARAGVPTVAGDNYHTYTAHAITLKSCRRAADTGDIGKAVVNRNGGGATLYGDKQPILTPLYRGGSADEVDRYYISNQIDLLHHVQEEDRLSRDVVMLPQMPQFRTTRRLDGDFTLSANDAYTHFEDSIAVICDFERRDYVYEVPLRALTRREYPNLITAGRSASGAGYAWDVLRVIPPAIATGQAAGEASALAIESGSDIAAVDVKELRSRLEKNGLLVQFEESWLPQGPVRDVSAVLDGHM